jgi:aminocarboxymuconate-semialdehyde decarboxylase
MTVIDAHSHFLSPGAIELLRRGDYPLAHIEERAGSEHPWVVCKHGLEYPLTPLYHDVEAKLRWMDERGIDKSLTSIAAPLFFYEFETEQQVVDASREINEAASTLVRESDGRIVGVAAVPIVYPELAAQELRRAVGELGLKGVEIGTSVGDMQLDDPSLEPFWAAAEELGTPVFLHPYTYMLGLQQHPGFGQYFLLNTIGNPMETHLAAARLTLGGVFDRHPGLTVHLSHGGGGLPFQLARLDYTYEKRHYVRESAAKPPSGYMENFLFDTVVYDEAPIRFLLDRFGPERVIFGTDHPFNIFDMTGLEVAKRLDDERTELIVAGNAARAYGL